MIKGKHKENKNQVDEPPVILWKIAKSLSEAVFEMSVAAHETTYDYPENQIQVLWKSTPIYRGIYRKTIISYTLQQIINYMQVKYNWSANLMNRIWWRPHGISLKLLKPN